MTREQTLEERVGTLEEDAQQARSALQRHAERLGTVEGALVAVRKAWRGLARHRRADLDGVRIEAPRALSQEEQDALAWLVEQRRRAQR